jgi:cold shock CspA family protein
MTGTVKKVLPDKKYGFIRNLGGIEYFFHRDAYTGVWIELVTDYEMGSIIKVEFDEVESMKGPRAENVRRV